MHNSLIEHGLIKDSTPCTLRCLAIPPQRLNGNAAPTWPPPWNRGSGAQLARFGRKGKQLDGRFGREPGSEKTLARKKKNIFNVPDDTPNDRFKPNARASTKTFLVTWAFR
jgi:hypothetical protein